MPKQLREISPTNIYHAILRGINKQNIFEDEEDYRHFQRLLYYLQKDGRCKIYAWCLMSNHLHLLLAPIDESIGDVMKVLELKYVFYFNGKYERTGAMFQGRFRSVPVRDDRQLLTEVRYIHMNPVKAGMVSRPEQYAMSSYREYLRDGGVAGAQKVAPIICDTSMVLGMQGIKGFCEFTFLTDEEPHLDVSETTSFRIPDEWAKKIMFKTCGCRNTAEFQNLSRTQKEAALKIMLESGVKVKQASRLTGCTRHMIDNI